MELYQNYVITYYFNTGAQLTQIIHVLVFLIQIFIQIFVGNNEINNSVNFS
jgi:hypothetical protein